MNDSFSKVPLRQCNQSNQSTLETCEISTGQKQAPAFQHRNQNLQVPTPAPRLMSGQTFFQDMLMFMQRQCVDDRLTPAAQLLLHTLCILANRNYWTYPFKASRDELKKITHINSDDTINRAKRQLKNLGYIDFEGKPAQFTIYSPTANRSDNQPANRTPPTTPIRHTVKQPYQTIYIPQRGSVKNEHVHDDDHDSRPGEANPSESRTSLEQAIAKELEELHRSSNSDG